MFLRMERTIESDISSQTTTGLLKVLIYAHFDGSTEVLGGKPTT